MTIANPETAPYGRAAAQALRRAGLSEAVGPKLVFGESVQQALQYAASGNADVALVARSVTQGAEGEPSAVPSSYYDPIVQTLGVMAGSSSLQQARDFSAFVRGPQGSRILESHGLEPVPTGGPAGDS